MIHRFSITIALTLGFLSCQPKPWQISNELKIESNNDYVCITTGATISIFIFRKSDNSWVLQDQSHIPINLPNNEQISGITSIDLSKSKTGIEIEVTGGGGGTYYTYSILLARVNNDFKEILKYATHDSHCSHHFQSEELCAGMEAELQIISCSDEFCPVEINVSKEGNFGGLKFKRGIHKYNGEEYVSTK